MKRRNLGKSVKLAENTIKKAAEIHAQRPIAPSWRLVKVEPTSVVPSSEYAARLLLEKSSSSISLDMNVWRGPGSSRKLERVAVCYVS
jgi:hypothetical protein